MRRYERPSAAPHHRRYWAARPRACRARTALISPSPPRSWQSCACLRASPTSGSAWPRSSSAYSLCRRARHVPATLRPQGAMAALLKDALKPNLGADARGHARLCPRRPLRQHCPRLQLHHGHAHRPCALATIAITEAGFGADLGAEKFLDIKCRMTGVRPSAVVVVATVSRPEVPRRRRQGRPERGEPRSAQGRHCPTCCVTSTTSRTSYGLPCVVAINALPDGHRGRACAHRVRVRRSWASTLSCPRSGPRAARARSRLWPMRCMRLIRAAERAHQFAYRWTAPM